MFVCLYVTVEVRAMSVSELMKRREYAKMYSRIDEYLTHRQSHHQPAALTAQREKQLVNSSVSCKSRSTTAAVKKYKTNISHQLVYYTINKLDVMKGLNCGLKCRLYFIQHLYWHAIVKNRCRVTGFISSQFIRLHSGS